MSRRADWALFFTGGLAETAARGLKESAVISLVIDAEEFTFRRRDGRNRFQPGEAADPDIRFWVPAGAMQKLLLPQGKTIGEVGIRIFELVLSDDTELKIKFKVRAPFLRLWKRGYFTVLAAGGPSVAKFLASHGWGSLPRLREQIAQWRRA